MGRLFKCNVQIYAGNNVNKGLIASEISKFDRKCISCTKRKVVRVRCTSNTWKKDPKIEPVKATKVT